MLIQYPNAGSTSPPPTAQPARRRRARPCVETGRRCRLPARPTEAAAYTFTVNNTDTPSSNPSTPFGVRFPGGGSANFANLGRTFLENLTYLYDPINGFVGYQLAGTNGTSATVIRCWRCRAA